MKEYLENYEEVLKAQNSSDQGLSTGEAEKRLAQYGKNKLKEAKKDSILKRFLKELSDPMILILIAAAIISGITAFYQGESFADVIIIIAVVIINAVLGVVQEGKAEAAIAALQEIAAASSKVLRDGKIVTLKSEDLVPGDIVVLEAGDAVPADGRIIESASMKIEEAALTGESVPVNKAAELLPLGGQKDIPLGDRKNMVYMGSTVVYGRGKAVLTGTGMDTEMGKIASALAQAKDEETPLQLKLNQLSKILTVLVLGICAVIFAVRPHALRLQRQLHLKLLYGSRIPGCGSDPRGSRSCGHHRTFHRRYQYVQTKRHHPQADGCGDLRLYPDHLL